MPDSLASAEQQQAYCSGRRAAAGGGSGGGRANKRHLGCAPPGRPETRCPCPRHGQGPCLPLLGQLRPARRGCSPGRPLAQLDCSTAWDRRQCGRSGAGSHPTIMCSTLRHGLHQGLQGPQSPAGSRHGPLKHCNLHASRCKRRRTNADSVHSGPGVRPPAGGPPRGSPGLPACMQPPPGDPRRG